LGTFQLYISPIDLNPQQGTVWLAVLPFHIIYLYYDKPFLEDVFGWLGKVSWSFDWPIIVENLCSLEVNIETAADVSPHNDVCDIYSRREGSFILLKKVMYLKDLLGTKGEFPT